MKKNLKYTIYVLILISLIIPGKVMSKGKTVKTLYIEETVNSNLSGHETSMVKKGYYSGSHILIIDPSLPYRVLFTLSSKTVYLIDDANKIYTVLSMDEFIRLSNRSPVQITDSDVMMEKTGKKKQIDKYQCEEYSLYIPKMSVKTYLWISGKLSLPIRLFYSFSKKTGLGSQNRQLIRLMEKRGGYTIESRSSFIAPGMYGKYINIRLNSIRYVNIQDTVFRTPAGYKKVPYGK